MNSQDGLRVKKFPVVPELDGIRGWAMSVVFICHLELDNGQLLGKYLPGGLAVSAFFFLSGYLITSLLRLELVKTGRIGFGDFYLRRALRIFPPFYLTILLSFLCVVSGLLVDVLDWPSVLAQMLFVSNYAKIWGFTNGVPGPPLWSLAVEEHFYMIFPLFYFFFLCRLKQRTALFVNIGLCVLALLFRMAHGDTKEGLELNYFLSHTRMDSILMGCILALWNNPIVDVDAWKPKLWHVAVAVISLMAGLLFSTPYFADTFRYTFQGMALFVLFSWVLHGNPFTSPILRFKPAIIVGQWSYTIYLIHGLIIKLTEEHLGTQPFVVKAGVAAGMTLLYAGLSYKVMERPLTRMRHNLSKVESGDAVAAVATPDSADLTPARAPQ